MTIAGIDTSNHNHPHGARIDWAAVAAAGNRFAVLKGTEGGPNGFIDPYLASDRAGAHGVGLIVLIYHFARPGDPVAQARWFLSVIGPLRVGEGIVLDDEDPGITPAWVKAFCDTVYAQTTVKPLVYMNQSYRDSQNWASVVVDNDGLWLAKYDGTTAMPPGGPWGSPAMKQYTSSGAVAGIVGPVDLDVFYGTDQQLLAYGLRGGPDPASTSQEKHMRVIQQTDRGIGVIGPGYYYSMTADQVGPAVAAWGQPVIYNTAAEFDAAVASATRGGNLFDVWNKATTHYPYSDRVGVARPDSDDLDGQVLSTRAAVEEVLAAVKTVQAPTIDEAKLAAALAADPAAIDALGKAIAANLQLTPRNS
ncbi:MAG: glycoside hydrolase family 25 protein [Frankiaceae bacterium]